MRFPATCLTVAVMLAGHPASAQYVKGNDAVTMNGGAKTVETPRAPATVGKPCGASANCHAGAWRMVETNDGLVECTEPWARPGTCRASSFGSEKLRRVWVVKRGPDWLQCQFPDVKSYCAPMFGRPPANLPSDAIQ